MRHFYFWFVAANLTTTIYSWTIKAWQVTYIINLLGSASHSCAFNLLWHKSQLHLLKCKEYMTNVLWRHLNVFPSLSVVTQNVFRFSLCTVCQCLLLKFGDSEGKAKRKDGHKSDCYLTLLPPEIPPVHLSVLPGWTPGPGSFHCGTAEGHSHQPKQRRRKDIYRLNEL